MTRPELSRRAQVLVAFLIPVVLVKTAPLWMGGGFGSIMQPGQTMAMDHALPPYARWDERQIAAAEHVRSIVDLPFERVPMADMVSGVEPAMVDLGPLDVEVSMILATESGNIALIGREPRRVGDMIGEWRIVHIDVSKRAVTFENALTGKQTITKLP